MTTNISTTTIVHTPDGSVLTPDTKISLVSASKIVSAILIFSVFPNPEQVKFRNPAATARFGRGAAEYYRSLVVRVGTGVGLVQSQDFWMARLCRGFTSKPHYIPAPRFHYA